MNGGKCGSQAVRKRPLNTTKVHSVVIVALHVVRRGVFPVNGAHTVDSYCGTGKWMAPPPKGRCPYLLPAGGVDVFAPCVIREEYGMPAAALGMKTIEVLLFFPDIMVFHSSCWKSSARMKWAARACRRGTTPFFRSSHNRVRTCCRVYRKRGIQAVLGYICATSIA